MGWPIFAVLLALWFFGFLVSDPLGGVVHGLLTVALAVVLIQLARNQQSV